MTSWASPDAFTWLAATSVAIVLLAAVLGEWARQRPAVRGRAIAGCACALLGGSLVLLLVEPTDIPTGWITVLQEGRSARNIRQLYGFGTHAGAGFYALVDWVSGHGPTTLPAVVRANLCLAVVNAIVFFFLASHVLRSWWASLAFAAAYACNLNTIQAAFSGTPAMVWTIHVWLACIAAAVVADHGASRRLRWSRARVLRLAGASWPPGCASRHWCSAFRRSPSAVAHVVGAEEGMQRALRSAGRHLRTIVTGPLSSSSSSVPGCSPWNTCRYRTSGGTRVAGSSAAQLLLPDVAAGDHAVLPVRDRRAVRARSDPRRAAVVRLLLAADQPARALEGLRQRVARRVPRQVPVSDVRHTARAVSGALRFSRAVLLGGATLLAGVVEAGRRAAARRDRPRMEPVAAGNSSAAGSSCPACRPAEVFLARNQQTEVRYLLDLTARYPRCVFVAKTPRADTRPTPRPATAGWRSERPLRRLDREGGCSGGGRSIRSRRSWLPTSPCVLFYRSMDCDLVGFDGCERRRTDGSRSRSGSSRISPIARSTSTALTAPEIRLGVYPVVVRDRSALARRGSALVSRPRS